MSSGMSSSSPSVRTFMGFELRDEYDPASHRYRILLIDQRSSARVTQYFDPWDWEPFTQGAESSNGPVHTTLITAANQLTQILGAQNHGLSGQGITQTPSNPYQTLLGGQGQSIYNTLGAYGSQAAQQLQALANSYQQKSALNKTPSKPSPPVKLKLEFRLGEIVAYRAWKVEKGFLESMSADRIWAPGEVMRRGADSKSHGVYAYKEMSHAIGHCKDAAMPIYGSVALWGDIVEHELGYRAEFAKILSLDGVYGTKKVNMKELRERYDVQ